MQTGLTQADDNGKVHVIFPEIIASNILNIDYNELTLWLTKIQLFKTWTIQIAAILQDPN